MIRLDEGSSSAEATDFHDLGRKRSGQWGLYSSHKPKVREPELEGNKWPAYRIMRLPFKHSSSGGKYVLSVKEAIGDRLHQHLGSECWCRLYSQGVQQRSSKLEKLTRPKTRLATCRVRFVEPLPRFLGAVFLPAAH